MSTTTVYPRGQGIAMSQSFLSEVKRLENLTDGQNNTDVTPQDDDGLSEAGSDTIHSSPNETSDTVHSSSTESAETTSQDAQKVTPVHTLESEESESITSDPNPSELTPTVHTAESHVIEPETQAHSTPDETQVSETVTVIDVDAKVHSNEARTVSVEVVEPDLPDPQTSHSEVSDDQVVSVVNAHVVVSSTEIDENAAASTTQASPNRASDPASIDASTQLATATPQLDRGQQCEAALNERIHDLEEQLLQQQQTIEKLRLDLEVIQTSKKELLAELAEAKRYILQLTDLQQTAHPETTAQPKSPVPLAAQTSQPSANPLSGRSPNLHSKTVLHSKAAPIRPTKHASATPAVLSSSALKGLPPMSTERVQSSPVQSSKPSASRPSSALTIQAPKKAQSHQSQQSSSNPSSTQKDSPRKGVELQKAYRRPMVHRDRPIPEAARDTHTVVPKPKLSDSEISWFD
ncbi:MAG: hypothetical protein AAFQ57_04585 [Cyanobacteria bacterium J06626_14]